MAKKIAFEFLGVDMLVQNPTHVSLGRCEELFDDSGYVMSEKVDGQRLLVAGDAYGQMYAWNRTAGMETVSVPQSVQHLGQAMGGRPFLLDGEALGGRNHWYGYVAFNLLMADGVDYQILPVGHRLRKMVNTFRPHAEYVGSYLPEREMQGFSLLTSAEPPHCRPVFDYVKHQVPCREGVIFRKRHEAMQVGSTDNVLRYVFVKQIDAFVQSYNYPTGPISPGSRGGSFNCAVWHRGHPVVIARAKTGLDNAELDEMVRLLEIGETPVFRLNYLAARTIGVVLNQPRVMEIRLDKTPAECASEQIIEALGEDRRPLLDRLAWAKMSPSMLDQLT